MQTYIDGADKVSHAISLLKQYVPEDGYYVAFSGGKDSCVILDLVKKSGVKYDAHFHFTSLDPPELIQFLKAHHSDIPWDRPKLSMFQLIEKKGFPPTRMIRYCCSELKETGGKDRTIITGIRRKESPGRAKREQYYKDGSRTFLHIIIDWDDNDVWEYIHKYSVDYCSLYNDGYKRIGCIMCPLQRKSGIIRDAERYPKYYKAYMRAFKKAIEYNESIGREISQKTPEQMMNWYIYGVIEPEIVEVYKKNLSDNWNCADESECQSLQYDGIEI